LSGVFFCPHFQLFILDFIKFIENKISMKKLLLIFCLFGFFKNVIFAQKKIVIPQKEWIQLWNGKDLNDWTIKISGRDLNENYKNTFKIENKILRVKYNEYENFGDNYGHLYYKTPYSHYRLKYEYRFTGTQTKGGAVWNVRNSGIMFHSQSAESLGYDQDFPMSLEIQFLGGLSDGKTRHTANLCTPGTYIEMNGKVNYNHCIDSDSKTYHGDQWVRGEILVLGDSLIQHITDGKVVLSYSKPKMGEKNTEEIDRFIPGFDKTKMGQALSEGYIALQAESHPIDFKKVELLNLKGCMNKKCPDFKSYYVVKGPCACD
jgi:Domain of Unknown Function (DUF1080)